MYSIVDLNGSQGQTNFGFSFDYLSEAHIHVYIDGEETEDFSFLTASSIALDEALTEAATVRIQRITPIDEAQVDFSNGSVLGESDLDTSVLQILFAQQELTDFNDGQMVLALEDDGTWGADNVRITELASPQNPTDAATKAYVDAQFAASPGSIAITALQDVDPAAVIDAGSLVVGNTDGPSVLTTLAEGANLDILEVDTTQTTHLRWRSLVSKLFQLLTTKGDLLVSTGATTQRKAVGSNDTILVADSAQADGLKWATVDSLLTSKHGLPGSLNLRGDRASTTTFTFTADVVTLRSATLSSYLLTVASGSDTVNIGTAGPAANGRDQAGAFSANSWLHIYWIYNGSSLDLIASATGPATGPTLPNGYTHWCYAATVRLNSSTQFNDDSVRGNMVHINRGADAVMIDTLSTAVETSQSSASFLPSVAQSVWFELGLIGAANTAGGAVSSSFRTVSGGASGLTTNQTAQTYTNTKNTWQQMVAVYPYKATYYYVVSDSGTINSREFYVYVASFTIPNHST